MVFDTPSAREATPAETIPAAVAAAMPPANAVAAFTVELSKTGDTAAEAPSALSTAAKTPEGTATPRRVSRSRSFARPVDKRLRTVPTGHRRRLAASS